MPRITVSPTSPAMSRSSQAWVVHPGVSALGYQKIMTLRPLNWDSFTFVPDWSTSVKAGARSPGWSRAGDEGAAEGGIGAA